MWNSNIAALTKDADVISLLSRQYGTSRDVRSLKALLVSLGIILLKICYEFNHFLFINAVFL